MQESSIFCWVAEPDASSTSHLTTLTANAERTSSGSVECEIIWVSSQLSGRNLPAQQGPDLPKPFLQKKKTISSLFCSQQMTLNNYSDSFPLAGRPGPVFFWQGLTACEPVASLSCFFQTPALPVLLLTSVTICTAFDKACRWGSDAMFSWHQRVCWIPVQVVVDPELGPCFLKCDPFTILTHDVAFSLGRFKHFTAIRQYWDYKASL